MTKEEALRKIDDHKNRLIDPVDMFHWTWIRVTINQIPNDEWDRYVENAAEIMSR